LDGTRAVAIPHKGIFSRNRKAYPHLEHIIDEINQLPASIILDGELYSSELSFQEIVGLVKRETLLAQDIQKQHSIKLHVYDLIIPDTSFHDRYSQLIALFHSYKFQHIVLVQTDTCDNKTTIQSYYTKYMHDGYEGIMLRNKNGLYKGVRSADLQKYKEFIDDEFEIVGFEEGVGLEAGCIIWICKTADGKIFHCRPRGTRYERQSLFINGAQYIGKHLTVRYQELSDTNIPRFPVGIAVRDYE
jgi:DNA ligase-1